ERRPSTGCSSLLRATWFLEGRPATLQEAPFIEGRHYLIAYIEAALAVVLIVFLLITYPNRHIA
ncbi:hypothetical protein, partial [Burkholderia gladioli]|uniref:hypothetical protein n=1 Tax=Burkholderia gladioli TaxID=28095 RepID=UPI002363D817